METYNTYRAKGKEIGLVFLFRYDLNGNLKSFEVVEGTLNAEQMKWLFSGSNFPASESIMRSVWMKDIKYLKVFEIHKSAADVSFESLWNQYDMKVKRIASEKAFNKLSEADKIKCFITLQGYDQYVTRKRIAKAHLCTFINQKYFEDDWSRA